MRKFAALVLLCVVIFVGCTTQTPTDDNSDNGGDSQAGNYPISMFDLQTEYAAVVWNYAVTADMPTPCHTFEVEELIMESFPEQVRLNIKVSEPGPAESCIQVIDTQTVEGELNVDEKATINLGTVTAEMRNDTAGAPGQ